MTKSSNKVKFGNLILFFIAFGLMAGAIYYVGKNELFSLIEKLDYTNLIIAVLAGCGYIMVRGAKWWYLFSKTGKSIPISRFLPVYLVVNAVGALTPMRAGEVIGLGVLPEKGVQEAGRASFVIVMDRFIELALLVIHSGLALLILGFGDSTFEYVAPMLISIGILALVGAIVLIILLSENSSVRLVDVLARKFKIIKRPAEILKVVLSDFHTARKHLENPKKVIMVLIFGSLLALFLIEIAVFSLIGGIVDVSILQTFIADGVARLAGVASMLPSGVGSGTLGSAACLILMGISSKAAIGAASVSTIILFSINLLLGAFAAPLSIRIKNKGQ